MIIMTKLVLRKETIIMKVYLSFSARKTQWLSENEVNQFNEHSYEILNHVGIVVVD